ncbi:MAG: ABC transporter permease [Spirochaetaceae bacterium]|jgi:NitT/TauT family transport system permease protein/sulfonate transport system permease protein|nr:ABC transporter permease [Spirochaetaceae bacterium]
MIFSKEKSLPRDLIHFLILPGILALLWHFLSKFKWVNPYLIPSPAKVMAGAIRLLESGELGRHLGISLLRVLSGYGISIAFALPLAFVFHYSPILKKLFHGIFEFLRAVPPLALIPLLILWFGLGEASKRAVIVLATFFPVFLNVLSGFNTMDPRWFELSKSLELSWFRHIRFILIPGALPQIVTGFRLGFGYAWRALLGAELFASSEGLGYLITDAQETARIDRVFVGILTIGLMGILVDALFGGILRVLSLNTEDKNWGKNG